VTRWLNRTRQAVESVSDDAALSDVQRQALQAATQLIDQIEALEVGLQFLATCGECDVSPTELISAATLIQPSPGAIGISEMRRKYFNASIALRRMFGDGRR
jgi:hypothetical protein